MNTTSGPARWRRAVAAGAVVLAAGGCVSAQSGPGPSPEPTVVASGFHPGSDGLGDSLYPKYGNGGYDVDSYDLAVRYVPSTQELSGVATITATATENLSAFNLDLHALTVESVTVDAANATSTRRGDELTVTPAAGLAAGKRFVTTVKYSGGPEKDSNVGFIRTPDGAVAVGQPEAATYWFPVNDHPRDKARYTITLTVPDGLAALSNGVLVSKSSAGDGFTSWAWSESQPMAPYLATAVIGTYRVTQTTHDGLPQIVAVHTSMPTTVDKQLAKTGEVIDFLASKFGPYPFDALGGIAIAEDSVRFALENQTRPVYGPGFFTGGDATWVIVHELAHQWFGDSVSLADWRDIWLNEGFATYASWLWTEDHGGLTAQENFDLQYAERDALMWSEPPGNPPADDLFTQRSGSVYTRGAMAVHALRRAVGDATFFTILKTWTAEHRNGNGTTADFIATAERVSGKQLDTLFQDWLYGKQRPARP